MTTTQQQSFRFATSAPPPARRNLVIEAGAGTGKTTAIVAEVLRLLLSNEDLDPERIVLVTFTEKAAGEIADRVHSALTEIDLHAHDARIVWPIGSEQPLFAVPPKQREAYLRACAKQLARIERLKSQTIHSFCQTLLRQHAIEAGIDPEFRIIEGFERAHFYGAAYDAWIDHETRVKPKDEVIREWEALLEHAGYLFLARGMIFSLVERRDLLIDESYTAGDIGEIEPQLRESIGIIRRCTKDSAIADFMRSALVPPAGSSLDVWIEFFAPVADAIRTENLHRDECDVALRVLRMHQKSKGHSIYDVLVSHRAAVALLSLTRRFLARLDAEKRAASVADFDDLLIQTRRLLDNGHVLARVRQQFDAIFIDEFQDTDRIQAAILDRLARDANGNYVEGKTVVVGDPKQSIYGFRRADPELYAAMTERLLKANAEPRVLAAQYRSEPLLVDAINKISAKVLTGGDHDPNVFRPTPHALAAAREREHADDAAITMLLTEPNDGEGRATAEAQVIADWIAGAADFRRYAILFRRLTNIDAYLDVFDARGIPYVLPPTRAFLDRPAPVDVLAVLRAIAYPTDLGAEVSAARTPYFALTDSEIVERGDCYAGFVRNLNALRDEARHRTVTELVDRVIKATNIEDVYRACNDGGRALRHLEHLRALAFAYDQSRSGSVRQFVDEITRRREEPDEVEPALFDESKNAVRILTVHGSKGLEFETVILPDLQFGLRGVELFTVEDPKSLVMRGTIETLAGYTRKSGDRCLHELGSLRDDAEARRLFYVAITRAKRDVAFVCLKNAKKAGFSKYLQEALPFTAEMWPALPGREVCEVDGVTVAFERTQSRGDQGDRKKILLDVPSEGQPPTAVQSLFTPMQTDSREWRSSSGRGAGILLHRVLERWDGVTDIAALLPKVASELGADLATTSRVAQRLATIAKSPMLTRIAAAETIGREIPVSYLDDDGVVVAKRIDRVVRENGVETVIDYKSGEPSRERLELDRAQVASYRAAMERLTGHPHRGLLWYIDDDRDVTVEA